jgi:hypothetical protein
MKPESLQVSGPQVLTPASSDDFVTQVFHHPEIAALCPNGKPSPRVKAIALIAGQVKEEQLYNTSVSGARRQSGSSNWPSSNACSAPADRRLSCNRRRHRTQSPRHSWIV